MKRLKIAYLIPWEVSEGIDGLELDWDGPYSDAYPIGGPVAEDRPVLRVSHGDGQRIRDVVVHAIGWSEAGRYYQQDSRQVIELPTVIIEWE